MLVNDIENSFEYDWKRWELEEFKKEIFNEQKTITFYEQIPQKGTIFEEGKQYLVFMNYNEEEDLYEINDIAYGIMEYDPETQMVKNIDTGEFVEIDWSLIK